MPYCLKSLEHLSQAGRLSLSDEFLRVWGANGQQFTQPQQNISPNPTKPSISHSLQKHLLDWVEFQATIGASNKGVLFATLLGGEKKEREIEREGGERERRERSDNQTNYNNHKLCLIDRNIPYTTVGWRRDLQTCSVCSSWYRQRACLQWPWWKRSFERPS